MPLESYSEIVSRIVDTIARPDLVDVAPDWLYMAELEAARAFDMQHQEKLENGEIAAGADHVVLPPDYLDLRWLQLETSPVRWIRSSTPFDRLRAQNAEGAGYPSEGMISGGKLFIEPIQGAARYSLFYQAGPEHLSDKVRTTYLSVVAGDYLLYTAILHSVPYVQAGARLNEWIFFQKRAEDATRVQLWNARFAGGPMTIRSDRGNP